MLYIILFRKRLVFVYIILLATGATPKKKQKEKMQKKLESIYTQCVILKLNLFVL